MRRFDRLSAVLAPSLLMGLYARAAAAETYEVSPGEDVEAAIAMLAPGDELIVHGGTYTLTERFGIDVQGTAELPIVVRAADGEVPVLHRPAADQNVIDVDFAEHLVLRGLEISGGSHGLRLIQARFVTIEACDIHDTADVALSANSGGEYEGLRILRNHIHDTNGTGEGMYLGCNDDACRMFDSVIEGNYVHHTNGPTVEQGDGIEIKEGSYNNVVRDNVIHDTNYPCILTYSVVGNGAPNVLERNVMWGCGDHGIQSAADATIRNNIILSSAADGIAMQPHQAGIPSNLVVVHNTILKAEGSAISVSGAAGSILIANNALYAQNGEGIGLGGDLSQVVVAGNVGQGSGPAMGWSATGDIGGDFVAASFSGAPPNDVFPANGSALVGVAAARHVVADDFNGTARNGAADAGAYVFDAAGNPGWTIVPGFKDVTPSTGEGGGAGTTSTTGTGAGAGNGSTGSGPSSTGAGGAEPVEDGGDDDGCSCGIAGEPGGGGFAATAALFALGLLGLNRRARGRARSR
jgi:hypothetical protein